MSIRFIIMTLTTLLLNYSILLATPPILHIESVNSFTGDKHLDFKNNLLIELNDGSLWKIHPKDTKKFNTWKQSDPLTIHYRTSHYFVKREHHFELFNYHTLESIRVMLIAHGPQAPKIIEANFMLVDKVTKTVAWKDVTGSIHYHTYTEDVYEKVIRLDDGSTWVIKKPAYFAFYEVGESVTISYNPKKGNMKNIPFLIAGTEREAVFSTGYFCN